MNTNQLALVVLAYLVDNARATGELRLIVPYVRATISGPGQGLLTDEQMKELNRELDAITGIPASE